MFHGAGQLIPLPCREGGGGGGGASIPVIYLGVHMCHFSRLDPRYGSGKHEKR